MAPFEQAWRAGLPHPAGADALIFGRQVGDMRPGERLAAALSELGPAFIKLGQVLSTRSIILGEEVAADLAKLQDQLPAFSSFEAQHHRSNPSSATRSTKLYLSFDDEPVSPPRSARCISR